MEITMGRAIDRISGKTGRSFINVSFIIKFSFYKFEI